MTYISELMPSQKQKDLR